ncbi:MAG: M28 family peptidase [Kiritimatiellae bacterium]|nr:M28 family peptidase [Kiritimatiellia bacterium]
MNNLAISRPFRAGDLLGYRLAIAKGGLLTSLLLLSLGCDRSPVPSNLPPPDAVDGAVALSEVARFVGVGPRVSGTPGASRAAAFISDRLRGVGYRALLDAFSETTPDGDVAFANVIGIPPGMSGTMLPEVLGNAESPVVILLSHYDTKAGISGRFVGANDSGSSTGLLLHLAGLIAARAPTLPPVVLAFVDGEEARHNYGPNDGLHGSRHLADLIVSSGQQDKVSGVIVLDMIGDKDLDIRIPPNTTHDLLQIAFKAAEAEGVRSQFGISRGSVLDDHVPFLERGIPAIDLIDFEFGSAPGLNDYWHTDADTMDKLSAESLEIVGRVVLRMLPRLAGTARPTPPSL